MAFLYELYLAVFEQKTKSAFRTPLEQSTDNSFKHPDRGLVTGNKGGLFGSYIYTYIYVQYIHVQVVICNW